LTPSSSHSLPESKGLHNMDITITINTDNAAFSDNTGMEVSRILENLAHKMEEFEFIDGDYIPLRDVNGNRVDELKVMSES